MSIESNTVYIIYDGDCPFCSHCAKALRIKQSIGALKLINARIEDYQPLLAGQKFDLNEGMLLIIEGRYYHAADAAHMLALISTPSDSFNKINFLLFHRLFLAKLFYPLFRWIRNLLLKIKRIKPLS